MAMNGNSMGDAIFDAVSAISIPTDEEMTETQRRDIFRAIAGAIVSHIQTNASVSGQAAVTTAPGTAPVTGTVS